MLTSNRCAAPCDWVPCSKRCEAQLGCGHQCPSVCGELCPGDQYCQVCCSDEIKSTMVDFIMGLQYNEIDIDVDPCIFPACGHFVAKSSMDGVMDMKAHYTMSAEDNPIAVSGISRPFLMDEVKTCPTCRSSLRNVSRYGRIVRRAMLDEATKKFIAWSNDEHLQLAQRLVDIQQSLSEKSLPRMLPQNTRPAKLRMTANVRLKQLHAVRDCIGGERYQSALQLWNSISEYIKKVRKEEQPFQRVADFVHHAKAQGQTQQGFVYDETLIQVRGKLQGLSLWLRCESIVFSDFIKFRQNFKGPVQTINLDFAEQMKECEVRFWCRCGSSDGTSNAGTRPRSIAVLSIPQ
ncbi:hypothetical protein BKA67DRAFT_519208 [Truncatella angustata]|uniref:Uncharacterized protein n=1 Tax=Truncatella angustata TaxID=152316 RepID=A0A9P8ZX25_9PEZI|nr:uncharacterized protein BKA67DRAFT_519208 [Truncatella angustata]KAH6653537.1 hypothetical protein BKA67DRAFT_519208 [Truncatella angustata]